MRMLRWYVLLLLLTFRRPASKSPMVRNRKWKKKVLCLSRRRVSTLSHFLLCSIGNPKGDLVRSPFLGYLFWRSKKGNWLSGHTRLVNDEFVRMSSEMRRLYTQAISALYFKILTARVSPALHGQKFFRFMLSAP